MIVAKFEEMKEFDREKQARKEELELMGRKLINLKHEYSSVQNLNNSYSEKIDILKKLDALGIDLMEFYDTIMLISTSNGIPIHLAFNKFSQDVREHYDLVLGFESRKESLKSEIQSLDFKLGKRIEEEQENEKKDLNYLKGSGINFVLGDRTFEL